MGKPQPPGDLGALVALFLRLGATAFGGPAVHIALMREEVVRRRRWLTDQEFLDLLGATNLIPGPNSTEMAIHIGYVRAGYWGLLAAGASFILPAFLLVLALAWAYVRWGSLPEVGMAFYGAKPVMVAIVAHALWGLGRTAFKDRPVALIALLGLVLNLLGVHELVLLLAGGIGTMLVRRVGAGGTALALLPGVAALPAAAPTSFSLGTLFWVFLKIGAVLFGSGYVLLAFLRADLVERLRWMTLAQLLDAVAVGQITPGPVFTTATFIGYLLGGLAGAVVATVGIFLPAFGFVAATHPFVPRLRRSAWAAAFLDGVNAVSWALMAAVTWYLARASLVDLPTALLALVSGLALFRTNLNPAVLLVMGAVAGILIRSL
ncbi:MAG: chromate efflux transporter [Armatimonadota bacterium]|nr:chromate efflux transporter [Armatimonadota bacterium]MDR7444743.1 chromate efflux transporter [Armatimonadota bacterium]MDR7571190.1 chromate efflux transporter [Armatimonadota bacterium]MDR7613253.1 chromate efflux transporter [Armatimonadota bacterium]